MSIFDDITEVDGRLAYAPLLARAGDTLTCPRGHAVADIVQDMRVGDLIVASQFANWRGREGWVPREGNPEAGIPADPLPPCPQCDASPWVGPDGSLRPWTQHGCRSFPSDPEGSDRRSATSCFPTNPNQSSKPPKVAPSK